MAWMVWSSAVEAALADAYRFAGGPVPDRGLVLGRDVFRPRTVKLGGPKVRRARTNADSQDRSDVSYLLSTMIQGGVSLARSVELAVQWDGILRFGPIHPITAEDFC